MKDRLPYLLERGILTCPESRKLGQSSRNLWSLLSSDPSYWSEKKRKIKKNITTVSALCWSLFFNNNFLEKKLQHRNAWHVIYNNQHKVWGMLTVSKLSYISLIFILIKYVETQRTFPLCHYSCKAIFLFFHTYCESCLNIPLDQVTQIKTERFINSAIKITKSQKNEMEHSGFLKYLRKYILIPFEQGNASHCSSYST